MNDDHLSENELNEYLDGVLSQAEISAIDAHLAVCPQCAEGFADLNSVFASLELISEIDFQSDRSAAVMGAIQPQIQVSGFLKWGTLVQSVVACLVLLISAPLLLTVFGSYLAESLKINSGVILEIWFDLSTAISIQMSLMQLNWSVWLAQWQAPSLPEIPSASLVSIFLLVVFMFFVGNGLLLRKFTRNSLP